VLELFATIKTKGKLLVCGPVLTNSQAAQQLVVVAVNQKRNKEVMDSSAATTRAPEAEAEIKQYIQRTVGFERTDKMVLAAVVSCCVKSTQAAFANAEDGGPALFSVGSMLFEVGDFSGGLEMMTQALMKQQALFGEMAYETAETVYMIAQCHNYMESSDAMQWYRHSLHLTEEQFGKDRANTACSLVGIGNMHRMNRDFQKGLECCRLAIARTEASGADAFVDVRADALQVIGAIHNTRREKQEGLISSKRSVELRESKHGPNHVLAANALAGMATSYGQLNMPKQQTIANQQVLQIHQKTKGPLSWEAGVTCNNIAVVYYNRSKYYEAAAWWKRATEAMEYTMSSDHHEAKEYRGYLQRVVSRMT
jgi:tetratricopeptide (TPR) repeat protein